MTSPASSYYENIIRGSLSYRLRYRQHRWPKVCSANQIRVFSWEHSRDLFTYRKGCLTVRKTESHPSWQVPEEYLTPIHISLSRKQEAALRAALREVPFSRLRSTPVSFVNLMSDAMITENFHCRLPMGLTYQYVDRHSCQALAPLEKALLAIAETSDQYREITRMEPWLFSEKRWAQLHPHSK